jgi:microsomal dipeptidase-like Zn-dependent dipeptidase
VAGPLLDRRVARVEARLNGLFTGGPYRISPAGARLHRGLVVADLHSDSLLWGRDLLARGTRGHVDVPRLEDGNVALQVFAASTKVPRHANLVRNDDRTDDVLLLALAQRWPPATWTSLLARALHLARRLNVTAARSGGRLRVVTTREDLRGLLAARAAGDRVIGGLLAVEGAHALDGDPANVDVLADAGYRMMSPSHLFDTKFGGSAHGVSRGGLTDAGREMIRRMERRSMIVDVAHASAATIADVLAVAARPVVASHTGVCGTCDHVRNLADDQLRGIANTGGLAGIGFWETATGGRDAAAIARAVRYAVELVGSRHVAIGSDWDGAVAVPFDAGGLATLTDALLADGLTEDAIRDVMGGNVIRLLEATLPPA